MPLFRKTWLACGWLGIVLIIYLSLTPHPPQPMEFESSDKLEHILAYGLVMLWFCQIYKERQAAITGIGLIALGIQMEILQGMTDYRSLEYADMLADSIGVVLAWILAHTALGRTYQNIEIAYRNNQLNQIS